MEPLEKILHYVSPDDIAFDENNPRGESEAQIVSDPEFAKLITSIKEYGVLEPLIVRRESGENTGYVLVDGERRLRAATQASCAEVPVLVATDETNGRILAYQVHKLRKDWTKAAETKSIKRIIAELRQENPDITDSEVKKKIVDITGSKTHAVRDILTLIRYDDAVIERVTSGSLNMSYLVQIESSFVTRVRRSYPQVLETFDEHTIRNALAEKASKNLLGNTRYLMDTFKNVFQDSTHTRQIQEILIGFLKDKRKSIKSAYEDYQRLTGTTGGPRTKKQDRGGGKKKATKGKEHKKAKESAKFRYASLRITERQLSRIEDIRTKLERIAGTFSQEEGEYIKEAICCLENHCFKAATLMVWSCGMSRILSFVGKHLADFNKCSQDMYATPKSFYRHLSRNFQRNATDVEDIRENSNDRQLLSYICYKRFISVPDFRKLKGNYDTRNDCAHPTCISLSPNEIVVMFENVHDLLLTNAGLS